MTPTYWDMKTPPSSWLIVNVPWSPLQTVSSCQSSPPWLSSPPRSSRWWAGWPSRPCVTPGSSTSTRRKLNSGLIFLCQTSYNIFTAVSPEPNSSWQTSLFCDSGWSHVNISLRTPGGERGGRHFGSMFDILSIPGTSCSWTASGSAREWPSCCRTAPVRRFLSNQPGATTRWFREVKIFGKIWKIFWHFNILEIPGEDCSPVTQVLEAIPPELYVTNHKKWLSLRVGGGGGGGGMGLPFCC